MAAVESTTIVPESSVSIDTDVVRPPDPEIDYYSLACFFITLQERFNKLHAAHLQNPSMTSIRQNHFETARLDGALRFLQCAQDPSMIRFIRGQMTTQHNNPDGPSGNVKIDLASAEKKGKSLLEKAPDCSQSLECELFAVEFEGLKEASSKLLGSESEAYLYLETQWRQYGEVVTTELSQP